MKEIIKKKKNIICLVIGGVLLGSVISLGSIFVYAKAIQNYGIKKPHMEMNIPIDREGSKKDFNRDNMPHEDREKDRINKNENTEKNEERRDIDKKGLDNNEDLNFDIKNKEEGDL